MNQNPISVLWLSVQPLAIEAGLRRENTNMRPDSGLGARQKLSGPRHTTFSGVRFEKINDV